MLGASVRRRSRWGSSACPPAHSCTGIRQGRSSKTQPDLPQAWRNLSSYLHLHGGRLWYHPPPDTVLDGEMAAVIAVPRDAIQPILEAYHSDEMLSHPRTAIMNKLLRRRFFWPTMTTDVKKHVRQCSTCSRAVTGRRKSSVLAKCQLYTQPASVVGFDIVGPSRHYYAKPRSPL